MKENLLKILAATLMVSTFSTRLLAGECKSGVSDDPRIDLTLESAKPLGDRYVGTFRVSVGKLARPLNFVGTKRDRTLQLNSANVVVEFLDLNSNWVAILELPGSDREGKDSLRVNPGSTALISAELMSSAVAELAGVSEFRIVVRVDHEKICLVSRAFRAKRKLTALSGFESAAEK